MSFISNPARVLIVDDEPALAYLFYQCLSASFRVHWFSSGPEALEHLRKHRVDLLVTDLMMPQINGLALTDLAKKLYPQLKVVMISGVNPWTWCRGDDPRLTLVDAYLPKPVTLGRLRLCCEQILQVRPEPNGARMISLLGAAPAH